MSNTGIEIGNSMLEYMDMLAEIINNLGDIEERVKSISTKMEESYQGEAREEMDTFLSSLSAHINRLMLFYNKGLQYTKMTYQSFYYNDQEMAKWIISKMNKGA